MMKRICAIFLLMGFGSIGFAASEGPQLSKERIVVRTNFGDFVLALYSKDAPLTSAQILKLMRAGVYETFPFVRLEHGFVAQLADHNLRKRPLSPDELAMIKKLPVEAKNIKHTYGTVSMARWEEDLMSSQTSFSILMVDAPHLDGLYTPFGRVVVGMDVVENFFKIPTTARHEPKIPLEIQSVQVLDSEARLADLSLRGPQPIPVLQSNEPPTKGVILGSFSLIAALAALGVLTVHLRQSRWSRVLFCLALLVSSFSLFALYTTIAQEVGFLSILLFILALVTFKLLGQFETAEN